MKVASSKLKVYFSHLYLMYFSHFLSILVYFFYFVTEYKHLLNVPFESASQENFSWMEKMKVCCIVVVFL